MVQAEYLIFAESSAVDDMNRLSITKMSDKAYVKEFPSLVNIKAILKIVPTDKAIINKTLSIKYEVTINDQLVATVRPEFPAITIEKNASHVITIDFDKVPFPKAGVYKITVFIDDQPLISRPYTIRLKSELEE